MVRKGLIRCISIYIGNIVTYTLNSRRFPAVFRGRAATSLFERIAEIIDVIISYFFGDGAYGQVGIGKCFFRCIHSQISQILHRRTPGFLLESGNQSVWRKSSSFCSILQCYFLFVVLRKELNNGFNLRRICPVRFMQKILKAVLIKNIV